MIQPFRFLLLAMLLLLLLLLQDSTFAKKECITLNRGKELKEHVSKSHVLLILADGSTTSSKKDDDDEEENGEEEEDNDTYLQLCNRLETTPEARTKDFEIALVKDSNLKRLVMKSAQPALPNGILERMKQKVQLVLSTIQQRQPEQESGSKESKTTSTTTTPPKYPEYILYKMNASEGIRYLSSKDNDDNLEEATADEISDFVSQQLGRKKIGNFVYSLGTYDLIASQIVNTTGFVQQVWAYGVARFVQVLFLQHPILSKVFKSSSSSSMYNDFEYDLVQEYIKIGIKVVENGLEYPSKQVQRLQKMLDDPDTSNNIGDLQKETLSQRIHILQKFSEPITVDPHDLDVFQMKMALNFLTLFLLIVMVPYVLMAKTEEDDDDDDDDEKSGQEDNDDDDATANDSTKETTTTTANPNTPMSKQEKRALAIQRAKESMQADKEKVEQVKQQRKQQGGGGDSPVPTPVFSESQLNAMKVTKLKELLSDRGLKTTGKKNELIDRLMQQSS